MSWASTSETNLGHFTIVTTLNGMFIFYNITLLLSNYVFAEKAKHIFYSGEMVAEMWSIRNYLEFNWHILLFNTVNSLSDMAD